MKTKVKNLWRKKYIWVLVVAAILGSLTVRYCLDAKINDVLVFNTFIVLIWYSRETMDLKVIANKQTYGQRVSRFGKNAYWLG